MNCYEVEVWYEEEEEKRRTRITRRRTRRTRCSPLHGKKGLYLNVVCLWGGYMICLCV